MKGDAIYAGFRFHLVKKLTKISTLFKVLLILSR